MPEAMMALTAAPASLLELKAAINVCVVSGFLMIRSVILVMIPNVPSEPTKAPTRS